MISALWTWLATLRVVLNHAHQSCGKRAAPLSPLRSAPVRQIDDSKSIAKFQRCKYPLCVCYSRILRTSGFTIVSRQRLRWIESRKLKGQRWLLHAFSTRQGGTSKPPAAGLNLGFIEFDQRRRVEENRRLFLRRLGAEGFHLAALRQIHSALIYLVVETASAKLEYGPAGLDAPGRRAYRLASSPAPQGAREGDALLTNQAGILLTVRSADCAPLLLVDPRHRAVAAVHAGWRGALKRIAEKTVGEMQRVFGTRPRDLLVAIGPSIRACCYEVGEEVREEFCSSFTNGERFFQKATRPQTSIAQRPAGLLPVAQPPGHDPANLPALHLDLVAVARAQLESAGIPRANVEVTEFCTACRTDLFFSHRKEGGQTGRMMAVIGIRAKKL